MITVKQGDTWPPVKALLKETNEKGELVPITTLGSAVKILFVMKNKTVRVEGTCTLLNEETGEVSYEWGATDTSVVGLYDVEFQIEWGAGKYETVPNDEYSEINIVANLAKEH